MRLALAGGQSISPSVGLSVGGGAGASSFSPGTGMQYATKYAFKKKRKDEK